MTESKKKEKERARSVYVPPLTEVYACDPHEMMVQSYEMGGDPGSAAFGNYFHGGGNAGGASFGNSFSGGGSAGGGSFGNSFGGGGSAGRVSVEKFSTGAKDFGITFSDVWE